MKLAVIGSRNFQDYAWLEQCLLQSFRLSDIEAVVSGGARGADALAMRFAHAFGLPLEVVPADWERYGRQAGPIRNSEIVRRADVIAAFWDGASSGTRDSIAKARSAGRRILIFPYCPQASASVRKRPVAANLPSMLPLPGLEPRDDRLAALFPEESGD